MKPFDPGALVLIAFLNPVVALVGFLMGRAADQPQKLIIAGFTAAIAGAAVIWFAAWTRLLGARGIGGEAGLFVLQFVIGTAWAAIGYYFARRRP